MIVHDDGLSFNVEVGQTVLGRAHLHHQNNFASYAYNPPQELRQGGGRPHRGGNDEEGDDSDAEGNNTRNGENQDNDQEDATPPRMTFEISLSAFLNCLNIFGDSTVRPVSSCQLAAREKWKQRQRAGNGDHNEGTDLEHEEDNDSYMRPYQRAGSTTSTVTGGAGGSSRKKTSTAMVLSWEAEGCPLVLLLEENDIVTRCELTTFEAGEIFELPYDDADRMQKLILQSSWLSEALSEIDPSCERLTMRFSPPGTANGQAYNDDDEGDDTSHDNAGDHSTIASNVRGPSGSRAAFSLEGVSNSGSVQMDYPFTREVLEVCECERAIRNSYRFSHLLYCRGALTYSTKASLRTDSSGVLSLQFMIPNVQGSEEDGYGFVEFACMPLEEE